MVQFQDDARTSGVGFSVNMKLYRFDSRNRIFDNLDPFSKFNGDLPYFDPCLGLTKNYLCDQTFGNLKQRLRFKIVNYYDNL